MKNLTLMIIVLSSFQLTLSSQPCLPGGIIFSTQADIDNFQTNYPNCTEIGGDVLISGNGITNLSGLTVLTSIGGSLRIDNNNSLISLAGLNALTVIGGYLDIVWNESLTSLTGLNTLTSIGGAFSLQHNEALTSLTGLDVLFSMGVLYIQYNSVLTSLTGLDAVTSIGEHLVIDHNNALTSLHGLNALTSIGGELYIMFNEALTGLAGLENINSNSITNLHIYNNISLATCEVKSICNYLASPNGIIEIHDNASGCNNQEEVEIACASGLNENTLNDHCTVNPNPFSNLTTLEYELKEPALVSLIIYNYLGHQVDLLVEEHQQQSKHQIKWDAEGLQSGIYFYKLTTGSQSASGKIIVNR